MNRTTYSIEEIAKLKQNPSVFSCTENSINYSPIESFFGHMKDALNYTSSTSFSELRLAIEEYMRYYNNERKQWTRNRMTPVEYRKYLLRKL